MSDRGVGKRSFPVPRPSRGVSSGNGGLGPVRGSEFLRIRRNCLETQGFPYRKALLGPVWGSDFSQIELTCELHVFPYRKPAPGASKVSICSQIANSRITRVSLQETRPWSIITSICSPNDWFLGIQGFPYRKPPPWRGSGGLDRV